MCFSAAASFTVAAVTGLVGVAAVSRVRDPRDYLLASFPILFAVQQAAEGWIWLKIGAGAAGETLFIPIHIFILFATVLWPVISPLSVFLIEPDRGRRRILQGIFLFALVLAGYFLYWIVQSPPIVSIHGNSLQYRNEFPSPSTMEIPYLIAAAIPFFVSSYRIINLFGAVIFVGFVASRYLHYENLISIWCFFAAIASLLIYWHVARRGRA